MRKITLFSVRKLSALLAVCMIAALFAIPVGAAVADEDRGLTAYMYDFENIDLLDAENINAAIDWALDNDRDLFEAGEMRGQIPRRIPNLTMESDELRFWAELVMGYERGDDHFGMRIHGYLVPAETGTYTLQGNIDNAFRLWIDGELWFDQWEGGYWTDQTGIWPESLMPMELVAGQVYEVYAHFVENWGGEQVLLEWRMDDGGWGFIPNDLFFRTREAAEAGAYLMLNPPEVEDATETEYESIVPISDDISDMDLEDTYTDVDDEGNDEAVETDENVEDTAEAAHTDDNDDDDGMNITLIIILAAAGVVAVVIIIAVATKKKGK